VRRLLTVAVLAGAAAALCGCGSGSGRAPEQVIGQKGLKSGQFIEPRGLTVSNDGGIICVDTTGRVQRFSPEGEFVTVWRVPSTEKGRPEGLAIDLDGNILVADTHYSRVLEYPPRGGDIVVEFGSHGEEPGQMVYPLAVAVSSRGEIYVAEYGGASERVQRFSAEGKYISGWGRYGTGMGEFRRPSGIAIDSSDRVYVADAGNHRVQRFTAEGEYLDEFGTQGRGEGNLSYPYDVAVSGDRAAVCEYGNCRVSVFTLDGEFVSSWGGPGSEPGLFATPWCIAVGPRGRLYVADTKNNRVQVFDAGWKN